MTTTLPKPHGICKLCQDTAPAIKHRSGRWFVYCEHNRTGGVLEPQGDGSQRWQLFTPVAREQFTDQMQMYAERFALANVKPAGNA